MTQSDFIAVIDLGTSKIKGVVGRKSEYNVISILESETIDSGNSVRRGMVYNIEEAGANIRKLLTMLENKIDDKIGKVYVSLTGQSLHTIEHIERKNLSSNGIVTQEIVDQLNDSAGKYIPDLQRNYAVADVEYYVDGKTEKNPVGVAGTQIEAHFQIIVGRPNLITNIERSVTGKAKIPIAGYLIGSLASAAISLSEEDKELGCAFIDFGAGTTSMSIYKNGILRRSVVIPFGGKNITKDISALNLIESEAEQLKIKLGKAIKTQESSFFSSPFSSKAEVNDTELIRVIGLRLDEITANIKEQIRLSGYENQLGAGVIITGGASQLKNISEYLVQKLNMPVRKVTAKKIFINNASELTNNPSSTLALGMLLLGKESCRLVEEKDIFENKDDFSSTEKNRTELKRTDRKQNSKDSNRNIKTPKQGIFTKVSDALGNLFSEDDE